MTLIRNKVLLFLFSLSLFSCSSGNVGYWEFKLIEKSIDTLTDIFNNNKSKTIKKIEIPSLPNPPDTTIQIAVSSLNGSNVSKIEIIALTERLRSELLLTKFFKVLERDVMDVILAEQGFQQLGCTTSECAVEMGQIMNVEKIVAGTISKVGNTFSSSIRVIDISSGSIDKIISFDYTGPIDELLKRGMKKIAIDLAS